MVALKNVLPAVFGYYLVAIGMPNNSDSLESSPIHNKILINYPHENIHIQNKNLLLTCDLEALPLQPETIDAVILFHAHESMPYPRRLIKEIYASLINGGQLIIFGFNPHSLWGLKRLCNFAKDAVWGSNWHTPRKLRHWLITEGFATGDYQTFYFRPPQKDPRKMLFFEGLGQIFWPYCGAVYMLQAKKTSTILTPLDNFKSFAKEIALTEGLPKPTSRTIECNHNCQK